MPASLALATLLVLAAPARAEPADGGAPHLHGRASARLHAYSEPAAGPFGALDVRGPDLALRLEPLPALAVSATYSADIVSGASPALVRGAVDAVSSASPFSDVRHAATLAVSWRQGAATLGAAGSWGRERDYRTAGGSVSAAYELAGRNATVFGTAGHLRDRSGTRDGARWRALAVDTAEVGLTQLLGPRTVARATWSYGYLHGFQANPYRWIALPGVVDAGGLAGSVVPETHPRTRHRHAVGVELRRALEPRLALGGGYVFAADSWGVRAHSADLSLRATLADAWRLRLRGRVHTQRGVEFYAARYDGSERFVTGDRDLGPHWNAGGELRAAYTLRVLGAELEAFALGGLVRFRYADYPGLGARTARHGQAGVAASW